MSHFIEQKTLKLPQFMPDNAAIKSHISKINNGLSSNKQQSFPPDGTYKGLLEGVDGNE